MQIGMIGLGRMGGNMVRRLLAADIAASSSTRRPRRHAARSRRRDRLRSLADFVAQLDSPRAIWLMLPAAGRRLNDRTFAASPPGRHRHRRRQFALCGRDSPRESSATRRALRGRRRQRRRVGTERGYCLMIGGAQAPVLASTPFQDAGARPSAAPRDTGPWDTSTADEGYLHCGPAGAGHFVKMVHNGIDTR